MAKDKEYRVPTTLSRDGQGYTIPEIMEQLAPACDCGDDDAVMRVLDENFIFGAWGHILSADEDTLADGELRILRANIRGLIVGAYRWQRPPRAVAPETHGAYEWVHFKLRARRPGRTARDEHGIYEHAICGLVQCLHEDDAEYMLKTADVVEQVNCPECLRWLIDYLVSQLAAVEQP